MTYSNPRKENETMPRINKYSPSWPKGTFLMESHQPEKFEISQNADGTNEHKRKGYFSRLDGKFVFTEPNYDEEYRKAMRKLESMACGVTYGENTVCGCCGLSRLNASAICSNTADGKHSWDFAHEE